MRRRLEIRADGGDLDTTKSTADGRTTRSGSATRPSFGQLEREHEGRRASKGRELTEAALGRRGCEAALG